MENVGDMKEERKKELEKFARQLKEKYLDTLFSRASRLEKLDSINIPSVPTLRVLDYVDEAKRCYINRCYRSSIICSSIATEQSFIHMLIATSEDWKKKYWQIENRKMTFGTILAEMGEQIERRKLEPLTKFVKAAEWLKNVRNEVSAHPTYVDGSTYFERSTRDQIVWENKVMFRDIRKLLQFFSPQRRKEKIETTKLTGFNSEGKVVETRYFKDFLDDPTKIAPHTWSDWQSFQLSILEELAFKAYKRMAKIVNGLVSYIKSHP
jgi:hypothetical protein